MLSSCSTQGMEVGQRREQVESQQCSIPFNTAAPVTRTWNSWVKPPAKLAPECPRGKAGSVGMRQLRLQFTHKFSTLKATRICWQQWSLSFLIEHKLHLMTESGLKSCNFSISSLNSQHSELTSARGCRPGLLHCGGKWLSPWLYSPDWRTSRTGQAGGFHI